MEDILQIHVSLQGSHPYIWRRIQVRKDTSFFELHHILQIAMGWKNSHLHEFNCDDYIHGYNNCLDILKDRKHEE